jgi:hypothetical protein
MSSLLGKVCLRHKARHDELYPQPTSTSTPASCVQRTASAVAAFPAARFKAGKDRMAQARAASLAAGPGDTRDLDRTVTEFGRLCMLSLMSDESRHCRVIG